MKQPPLLRSSISVTGAVITMTGVNVPLSNILAITDLGVTPSALIYLPQGGVGQVTSYTQAANSVLTLAAAPSGNNLQIIYDDGVESANAPTSVEATNADSQVYNYTATGAVAGTPVVIGPIDCSKIREISVHMTSVGAGFSLIGQVSNNGTSWVNAAAYLNNGGISVGQFNGTLIHTYTIASARFFRVQQFTAQTSGTTTLAVYASQQATPKPFTSVVGTITPIASPGLGMALYHTLISTASTNATSVKTSQGVIGSLILTNTAATWAYFKLINKASAPVPGTDLAILNIGVAPNSTLDCSTSFVGLRLTAGIAYYVSAGAPRNDNTVLPAANTFLVNMTYL
jgi:hypothetical protein